MSDLMTQIEDNLVPEKDSKEDLFHIQYLGYYRILAVNLFLPVKLLKKEEQDFIRQEEHFVIRFANVDDDDDIMERWFEALEKLFAKHKYTKNKLFIEPTTAHKHFGHRLRFQVIFSQD